MRAREASSCIREENIRYTVVWDPLQRWRMEARIAISRQMPRKLVPEGVEGRVAYKGMVEDTVFQLWAVCRAGMGYCGAKDVETLKETGKFIKISAAALRESHPHDIHITKEAPNYSVDE